MKLLPDPILPGTMRKVRGLLPNDAILISANYVWGRLARYKRRSIVIVYSVNGETFRTTMSTQCQGDK